MAKRLILSTEAINRSGYRLISSGARLDRYLKNPVLLFGHNTYDLPIGRLEDIKVANGVLDAVPVFDENDDFALACKRKYENGFLFAASIWFDPLTTSDDPKDLLKGQRYATVTSWELLEASLVTVPNNPETAVGLSAFTKDGSIIPAITKPHTMEEIAKALGLPATASEADVVKAIGTLSAETDSLRKSRAAELIDRGEKLGIINKDNKDVWYKLATENYQTAESMLKGVAVVSPESAGQSTKTVMGMLSAGKPAPAEHGDKTRDAWSFDEWAKKDSAGLSAMRKNDPERYQKLAAQKYKNA